MPSKKRCLSWRVMATANSPTPSAFLAAMACSSSTHQARLKAEGLFHTSTTSSKLPMRWMLLLNVDMYQLDGLLGPAIACCPSTITSNQTLALAASLRPSKNSEMASSVSTNGLPHVWLMNHVASPTCCLVSPCIMSSLATLPRLRAVRGLITV